MTKYTHMTETSPLLPRKAQNNIKVQVPKIRAHVNLQTTLQTLSGICLVVSFAGCTYAFGVFSSLLQAKLALKQKSLDLMASVGNLGLYLSLFVGFAVERFGFRRVILFGGLLVFGGFSYIWLAITGKLYVNEHLVTLAYFIAQVGACCHIATAVSATVKALPPSSRGTAVGLVKSYFGVSSAVLANLSSGVFSEYPLSFVCFVAILIPFAGVVGSSFMNIPKNLSELSNETNETPVNMLRFKQHWVLLITLLLVVSYVQYGMNVNFEWRVFLSSSLFLAVFAVLLVPFLTHQQAQMERSYMDWTASDIDSEEPCTNQTSNNNLTVFEAVQTFQMWALCFIFCVLSGAGLMVIYNVNAVANAAGERPSPFFVSLISLANGVGRLVAGICSDFVLRNTICSRLHLLGLVAALMSVAHIVLSTGHHAVLLPAFLAVGFLFGCTVSLVAVIVADLFGSKYIATNFGFVDTSPIVGSFIFATLVVNGSYEYNTVDEQGVQSCVGVGCFQMAFAVNATVCAAAAMLSMFLNARMQTA